jgi:hypothetical protein
VDVRTGKKYSLHGEDTFFKAIIGRQWKSISSSIQ